MLLPCSLMLRWQWHMPLTRTIVTSLGNRPARHTCLVNHPLQDTPFLTILRLTMLISIVPALLHSKLPNMPIYPVSWAVTYIPLWLHPSHQVLLYLAPSTTKQRQNPILRMMLRLVHHPPLTLLILLLPLARRLHLSRSQRPAGETLPMPSGPIPYTPCTKTAMPMMVSRRQCNQIQLYLFTFLLSMVFEFSLTFLCVLACWCSRGCQVSPKTHHVYAFYPSALSDYPAPPLTHCEGSFNA